MMSSLDIPFREEVLTLRKKVVMLETAESDNDRLRKEITRLKMNMQEEKSKFELDFMNQLSEIMRENATKMEEISGQLRESNNVNRALSEQLKSRNSSPEEKRTGNPRDISRIEDENQSLKNTIALLQKENDEMKIALDDYSEENKKAISNVEKEIQRLCCPAVPSENESRDLRNSARNEIAKGQNRDIDRSPPSCTIGSQARQSDYEETRIMGNRTSRIIKQLERNLKNDVLKKKSSFIEIMTDTVDNRSSDIKLHSIDANENDYLNQKPEIDNDTSNELQKGRDNSMECSESPTSKLEAELISMNDLLALEKDTSRDQMKDLHSKLEALHETLSHSEDSRASLALDKEKLIAELNLSAEEKFRLQQKIKHLHQQLKQLKKIVDKNLDKVENTHKNNDIQIQCLRDQVESLKQELLLCRDQIGRLNKQLEEKEKIEIIVQDTARKNIQSLHTQINKFQNELIQRHKELSEVERKYKKEIGVFEKALESVNLEFGETIRLRDAEIEKLKRVNEGNENLLRRFEKEKEQLVLSMQDMMKNRRGEVDNLQKEILEMTTRLTKEARDVSTLKARLEEKNYQTKEIGRLRVRVAEMSRRPASKMETEHNNTNNRSRNMDLERENRELRRMLKDTSAEPSTTEEKRQKHVSVRGSGVPLKSVQVRREQNASQKHQVERLARKMKKESEM